MAKSPRSHGRMVTAVSLTGRVREKQRLSKYQNIPKNKNGRDLLLPSSFLIFIPDLVFVRQLIITHDAEVVFLDAVAH